MSTIYLNHEYVTVRCGLEGCDQHFAMSRHFYDETQRDGRTWYCPSGHPRAWRGETTEQKLKAAEARNVHLADQLEATKAQAELARVQILRERQRFAKGVCPCCNRSFPALTRHMATQHPEYNVTDLKPPTYRCSCGSEFATFRGLRVHQGHSRSDDWLTTSSRWRAHMTEVGA